MLRRPQPTRQPRQIRRRTDARARKNFPQIFPCRPTNMSAKNAATSLKPPIHFRQTAADLSRRSLRPEKMGARQSEKENQRGSRIAFQRQRLLHHRLSQRKIQGRRPKKIPLRPKLPPATPNQLPNRQIQPPKRKKNEDDVASVSRFNDSTIQRLRDSPRFHSLRPVFSAARARGFFIARQNFCAQRFRPVHRRRRGSQFRRWPLRPRVATDANLVRLEPALLAVSAERIKESLWRDLKIKPDAPWRGKIYLALHPAQSLDENVTIVSAHRPPAAGVIKCSCPMFCRARDLSRALVATLLLEFANRNAQSHSAEIPAWLADGLSQQLLADSSSEIILSTPNKIVNGLPSKSDGHNRKRH